MTGTIIIRTDVDGRGWVCVMADAPTRIVGGPYTTIWDAISWRARI